MKTELDESVCVYGSGVLLKHLQALMQEIEGVESGAEDIEHIHRMRVASRRLRSAFSLFSGCLPPKKQKEWLRQIKQVTRALGAARDADVQIARLQTFLDGLTLRKHRPGVERLLLRLRQQRQRLQPGLQDAMRELQSSGVLAELQAYLTPQAARQEQVYLYTPALYRHAFTAIAAALADLLAYDAIVYQPDQVEQLHAMRISAKRLRYTIENLAPLYPSGLKPYLQTVRKTQELLGDIHDCDVWIAFLPRFLEEEKQRILDFYNHTRPFSRLVAGIEYFCADCAAARSQHYENFVGRWRRWQEEGLWTKLGQEIRAPFFQSAPGGDRPKAGANREENAQDEGAA